MSEVAGDVRLSDVERIDGLLGGRETLSFVRDGRGSWVARTYDPDDRNPSSCSVVVRGSTLSSVVTGLLTRL